MPGPATLPSLNQNQSKRLVSVVTPEITTSATTPSSKTMNARTRLEWVITTLSITRPIVRLEVLLAEIAKGRGR